MIALAGRRASARRWVSLRQRTIRCSSQTRTTTPSVASLATATSRRSQAAMAMASWTGARSGPLLQPARRRVAQQRRRRLRCRHEQPRGAHDLRQPTRRKRRRLNRVGRRRRRVRDCRASRQRDGCTHECAAKWTLEPAGRGDLARRAARRGHRQPPHPAAIAPFRGRLAAACIRRHRQQGLRRRDSPSWRASATRGPSRCAQGAPRFSSPTAATTRSAASSPAR